MKWGTKAKPTPTATGAKEGAAPEAYGWMRPIEDMRKEGLRVGFFIDGNSIFCREYHAHPDLRTKAGAPTGAIYGWTRAMADFIAVAQPDIGCVAWDGARGERAANFRRAIFPGYKGKRERDERLEEQLGGCERFEICDIFNFPQAGDGYTVPGETGIAEADDILATLVRRSHAENILDIAVVISGDRDMLQLVDEDGATGTAVLSPVSGLQTMKWWAPADVREKFHVGPTGLRTYKAIVGDASDAIPGVSGLGEKKFDEILAAFRGNYGGGLDPSLEQVYANRGGCSPRVKKLLEESAEDAALFYEMVRLRDDVDLPEPFGMLIDRAGIDWDKFLGFCERMEFRSLMPGSDGPTCAS